MGDEDAVLRLLEEEGEGVEGPRRAHPGEVVRPQIDLRLEPIAPALADAAVDAVAADDEVVLRLERLDVGRLLAEAQLNAEFPGPRLDEQQERAARAAAEAVAGDAVDAVLEVDLDVVPICEIVADRGVARLVGGLEDVERLVGEDDTESEGVVGLVALEDRDIEIRPVPLHQEREIEPRRPAADHRDTHLKPLFPNRLQNCFRPKIIFTQATPSSP
jgi:hypothetical protein